MECAPLHGQNGHTLWPLPAASIPPYCAAEVLDALQARPGCMKLPKSAVHRGYLPQAAQLGSPASLLWEGKALPEGQALTAPKASLTQTLHVRQQRPVELAQGAPSAAACCCRFRMTAQAT